MCGLGTILHNDLSQMMATEFGVVIPRHETWGTSRMTEDELCDYWKINHRADHRAVVVCDTGARASFVQGGWRWWWWWGGGLSLSAECLWAVFSALLQINKTAIWGWTLSLHIQAESFKYKKHSQIHQPMTMWPDGAQNEHEHTKNTADLMP